MPTIALINKATVQLPFTMAQLAASLQTYADVYLGPTWGVGCTVKVGDPLVAIPGSWPLYLFDDSDVAGAEGYHQDEGFPQGFAFVKTTMDWGDDPVVTISHEFAEMLVDPLCFWFTPGPHGKWYVVEICDPVEGDSFIVEGLALSNFILPAWYGAGTGTRFDHLGKLTAPFSLDAGGYFEVWTPAKGWTSVFGSKPAKEHFWALRESNPFSRHGRRMARFAKVRSRKTK